MSTISKKNIKATILVLDQNFGTLNLLPNSNNIVGIDVRSYTLKALLSFINWV